MKARRIENQTCEGIGAQEPAGVDAKVPLTQVVEAKVWVILLARVQINIRRAPSLADDVPEGIVVVSVGHGSRGVRQQPHVAVAVISVEAGPRGLALANAVNAVGIDALNLTDRGFLKYLGVASTVRSSTR